MILNKFQKDSWEYIERTKLVLAEVGKTKEKLNNGFQVYEGLLYREHSISVFHLYWQQRKRKRAKKIGLWIN